MDPFGWTDFLGAAPHPVGSPVPPVYKLNIYIKIAQLYLEDDDAVSAETFINRAINFIHDCNDPAVVIKFKVASAADSFDRVVHCRTETSCRATEPRRRSALPASWTTNAASRRHPKSTWSCPTSWAKTKGRLRRP